MRSGLNLEEVVKEVVRLKYQRSSHLYLWDEMIDVFVTSQKKKLPEPFFQMHDNFCYCKLVS